MRSAAQAGADLLEQVGRGQERRGVLAIPKLVPGFVDQHEAVSGQSLVHARGDVFVRVPGKTRPATSTDLDNLERRRDRSPHTGAQVNIEYGDRFHRVDSSSVVGIIREMVEEDADSLLAGVRSRRSTYPYGGALASLTHEDGRSPEKFHSDVEEWREEANEKATEVVSEFLRHELARGRWTISNDSDRYLEAVRAQIDFPPGVVVLMASDTEYCDHGGPFNPRPLLPDLPPKWATLKPLDIHYLPPPRVGPISAVRAPEFEVDETPHGTQLTWQVGDLRPRSVERGDELFAVVTDDHLEDVNFWWRVTARGVDHVFKSRSRIACAEEPGVHLRWGRAPKAGEDNSD